MKNTSCSTTSDTPLPENQFTVSVHHPPQSSCDSATGGQATQQMLIQEVRCLAGEVEEMKQSGAASPTADLTHWLSAQFVVAAKSAAQAGNGRVELKTLCTLSTAVVRFRIGDQNAERLAAVRARLDLDIRKHQRNQLEEFVQWRANEKVKEMENTDEDYSAQIKALGTEIFGEGWDD